MVSGQQHGCCCLHADRLSVVSHADSTGVSCECGISLNNSLLRVREPLPLMPELEEGRPIWGTALLRCLSSGRLQPGS